MTTTTERATIDAPQPPASAWAPLRHRIFLALFIAQIASNIGSMMQNVGAAWLMGDLSASPTLVALVQTATLLPVFLIGLPAGALADIVDRRRLLIVSQTWMLAAALCLAALSFADLVTPLSLLLLTFALGLGGAVNAAGLAGHPARAGAEGRVPPSRGARRARRSTWAGRSGRRSAASWSRWPEPRGCSSSTRVSFLAVVAVLVRWRRPSVGVDAAGRDHGRGHEGRAPLCAPTRRPCATS